MLRMYDKGLLELRYNGVESLGTRGIDNCDIFLLYNMTWSSYTPKTFELHECFDSRACKVMDTESEEEGCESELG